MQLVRFDPLNDFNKAERDLDRFLWHDWFLSPSFTDTAAMDLYEEDGKLISEVNLPNFNKEDVKVTLDKGILEISAEHKEKDEKKNKRRYFVRETNNRYLRRVTLPEGVESDKIEAEFKDGMLKITIQETTPSKLKARDISIK